MQKSVEVEYWVTDEAGELVAPEGLVDATEGAEEEFVEPLLEVKTPPCETVPGLRDALLDELEAALERADDLGKRLVPLGTPIDGVSIERLPGERARIQERVLGRNFEYAKHCAGTHLHFEQRNVVDQLNVLVALDPALALVNSSPYFRGERVADGARAYVYRRKCYEALPDHGRLWKYADTVAQWKRRLGRRFEEFRAAAVEAGVDGDAVDANFTPNDVVWTPVRLRDTIPKVEWRSPDAALPGQTLQLVEAVDAVMEGLHDTAVTVDGERGEVADDGITLPEFDVVCDLAEAAMVDGLRSSQVVEYLDRMGFDVGRYDPLSRELGGQLGDRVGPAEARSIRLRAANRLERDVEGLRRAV